MQAAGIVTPAEDVEVTAARGGNPKTINLTKCKELRESTCQDRTDSESLVILKTCSNSNLCFKIMRRM